MPTLEELYAKRDELESSYVGDMTLREVQKSLAELEELDRVIRLREPGLNRAEPPRPRRYVSRRIYQNVPQSTEDITLDEPARDTARPHRRVSEQNVGRYIMTVLAASLCLLALGVFIMSFWLYLPDPLKFLVFAAIGCVLEGLGFVMASRGNMRPFWLGIAGVGAGGLLLVLLAGSMVWYLYDILLAGILILIWFSVNFLLAYKQKASVFYAISYIGGLIAVWIAGMSLDYGMGSETILSLLLAATTAIGLAGYFKTRRMGLLLANMAYCWAAGLITMESYTSLKYSTGSWVDMPSYSPTFIAWFLVIVAAVCLSNTRFLFTDNNRIHIGVNAILVCANSYFVAAMCGFASTNEAASGVASVLYILGLIGSCPGYLIGIVPAFLSALSEVSWDMTAVFNSEDILYTCEALLPCIVALAFCAIPAFMRKTVDRIGIVLLSFGAVILAMQSSYRVEPHFYVACFALLCLALGFYTWNVVRGELYFNEPIDKLILTVCPAILLIVLYSVDLLPELVPVLVASLSLQAYGILYLFKIEDYDHSVPYTVWCIFRVLVYLFMLGSSLFPSDEAKVILTIGFMATLAFNLYRMVTAYSKPQAVISCVMANWHLWLIANILSIHLQLVLSLIGLLIGAGFIVCGFLLGMKTARQCGLACCILYVLKMGLFDISSGGLGTAGGLLLAGLVCFGISLAYNKMLRLYENPDDE